MDLMNRVYKPYLDKFMIVFIDDISICSSKNKEYEERLRLILGLLKNKELYKLCRALILAFLDGTENFMTYNASHNGFGTTMMQKEKIHEAQVESLKTENVKDENLHGMGKELRLILIELFALGAGNIEAGIATRNTPLEMGKHGHGFYHKTTKNNKQLRRNLGNRDHQKSYANVRRKPLEFHVEGISVERSDTNAYPSETLALPLDETQIDDQLHYIKELIEIMDEEVRPLKQSRISNIKVRWNSKQDPEFT
ncbi:hypothetical protein Tco_0027243 [Tanacetum coccineum]